MAKQNFLSGGFYGKLGQVVGQRWKNIRTIRTYVVPNDPKTPLQLEQRSKFKSSVVYAQAAMMSNYYSNWFRSEKMSAWNVRMSTSRELVKTYESFLSRLPLIPIDVEPPFVINKAQATQDSTTKDVTIIIDGDIPQEVRSVSIYATNNPNTQNIDDVLLLVAQNTKFRWKRFIIPNVQDFEFTQDTHIRIVSNDERTSEVNGFVSAEIVNNQSINESYKISPKILNIFVDSVGIVFTLDYPSLMSDVICNSIEMTAYINGTKQTVTCNVTNKGYNPDFDNKMCIEIANIWGTEESDIKFDNTCSIFVPMWVDYENGDKVRQYLENETVTLIPASYDTGTPFNAEIQSVDVSANQAVFTFAAQEDDVQSVTADNITLIYTQNDTEKSKLLTSGFTFAQSGKVVTLTCQYADWWETDCSTASGVSVGLSNLVCVDTNGKNHTFNGVISSTNVVVQGYHYKQSDFTFSGISWSGNTATIEYTYPVVAGHELSHSGSKSCTSLSYLNAYEPITKSNPTLGAISTVGGKLQFTAQVDDTNYNFTLATNQIAGLQITGLQNVDASSNIYCNCEDLNITNNLAETEHLPAYLKPKAIYLGGWNGALTYWDDYRTDITWSDTYIVSTVEQNKGSGWRTIMYEDLMAPKGKIAGTNCLMSIFESVGECYNNGWGDVRISLEAHTYTVNGRSYSTPSWSDMQIEIAMKGGYFNQFTFYKNFTQSGNKVTTTQTFDTTQSLVWEPANKTINGVTFSYKPVGEQYNTDDEGCTFKVTTSGKSITFEVSGIKKTVDTNGETMCYGFSIDMCTSDSSEVKILDNPDYSGITFAALAYDWEE